MKKIFLTTLVLPCALLAQDTKVMTTQDALINAVLTNTANYLEHKDDVNPNDKLEISTKKDSIDWNNKQLIKWQIIEPKDSLKIISDD